MAYTCTCTLGLMTLNFQLQTYIFNCFYHKYHLIAVLCQKNR